MDKKVEYKHIILKVDQDFKKFEDVCQKLGLKKATIVKKLIKQFTENPEKFFFN